MRNVRPIVLKGDKIAYPKLENVTMVICNDIMFLAVHQTQITDSVCKFMFLDDKI